MADKEKKRAATRQWRANNRKAHRSRTREWQIKNPEKVVAQRKRYRAKHAARLRLISRERARTARGLPAPTRPCPDVCECCNRPSERALALDHDHRTGKFRGWLCHDCNTSIGKLGDTFDGVMRAADYLKRA